MNNKKNILVSTFGTTWSVVPEILGFTNHEDVPLYACHPQRERIEAMRSQYDFSPVDEVWLIIIHNESSEEAFNEYRQWHSDYLPGIALHKIYCDDINDIAKMDDCTAIRDLVYRTVLAAHSYANGGQVVLSMVGGYKTLAADIQEACNIFGCHALLHLLVNGKPPVFDKNFMTMASPQDIAKLMPVVVIGKKEKAAFLYGGDLEMITAEAYPVNLDSSTSRSTLLVDRLEKLRKDAEVVLSNFSDEEGMSMRNFRLLSLLHPRIIDDLKNSHIGNDSNGMNDDLIWLHSLPKAELHCHFGGILSPQDMIEVALSECESVKRISKDNDQFSKWLETLRGYVANNDVANLKAMLVPKGSLRNRFPNVPEPYTVCAFLCAFHGHADLLDEVIYGPLRNPLSYKGIGIEDYERLGDLQGSSLLQSERCLRKACQLLKEKCRNDNVIYMELRCSPINYTRGGLTGRMVVEIILDELHGAKDTYFTLLFIASRHGKISDIYRHVELVEELFDSQTESDSGLAERFKEHFVGFDLAGAESKRAPKELRMAFEPLHERCLNITIHAGENMPADGIWQAVYYLNADRIGHGLTLGEREDLLERFREHRIAVEMCPSSNFQICCFQDTRMPETAMFRQYPLMDYMKKGIRVTVNTDDPGISRTDLAHEFLKAAFMTRGGVSRWEVLQLIYNSFTASFAHYNKRQEILVKAEKIIINLIKEQYGTR